MNVNVCVRSLGDMIYAHASQLSKSRTSDALSKWKRFHLSSVVPTNVECWANIYSQRTTHTNTTTIIIIIIIRRRAHETTSPSEQCEWMLKCVLRRTWTNCQNNRQHPQCGVVTHALTQNTYHSLALAWWIWIFDELPSPERKWIDRPARPAYFFYSLINDYHYIRFIFFSSHRICRRHHKPTAFETRFGNERARTFSFFSFLLHSLVVSYRREERKKI